MKDYRTRPQSLQGWVLIAAVIAVLAPVSVQAEELYLIQEVPDPTVLGDLMYPESGATSQGELRVRAIRFTAPEVEVATEVEVTEPDMVAAESEQPEGASIGFNIQFALGSPDLLPATLPYLDAVGAMLVQERTSEVRLMIAGHADATGEAAYNQQLSEARAVAVSDYLASNYGIASERLETVGYGEEKPLPDTNPEDGLNRRVEFQPL